MKTKKISLSIPEDLLQTVDRRLVDVRRMDCTPGLSRSDYICRRLAECLRTAPGHPVAIPENPETIPKVAASHPVAIRWPSGGHPPAVPEPSDSHPVDGLRAPARAPGFDAVDAVDQTTAKSKPRAIGYTDKDCLLMAKRYDPETLRRVFEAIGATDTAAQNLRIVEWQNIDGGRVKAAMTRLIDAVDAGKAKNPPGLLKHLIDTLSAAEIQKTLPGGNGKPKAGGFIPKGYPPDIYNRKKFKWSRDMNGWYPRNSFGDAETTGGVWKWQPGMTKGE
jgi:hypothetical protein